MREIKFRALVEHDGIDKIMEVVEIGFDNRYIKACNEIGEIFIKHKYKLMQYTGLNDKNDVEIYEGDIVKYTFDLPESIYATENGLKVRINKVFWSEWRSSFAVGNNLANNDLFRYVRNGNRVEVIGNIYENPELLEEN